MWYDDKIKEYADISRQINQRYCDTHGYDFIVSHENHFFDRHPAWERFPMIQSILDEGIYDYVVYIDADACFRHSCSRSLETIIAENADKHIIFTGDPEYILCTGFLIFKNSQISADFIASVIDAEYSKTMFYNTPGNNTALYAVINGIYLIFRPKVLSFPMVFYNHLRQKNIPIRLLFISNAAVRRCVSRHY